MTTMTDEVLDALVKGRQYLADHEWNRDGNYFGPSEDGESNKDLGCVCAIGAVSAARGCRDTAALDADPVVQRAWTVLSRVTFGGITTLNDEIAESKSDVLAVFDRAIEARKAELA